MAKIKKIGILTLAKLQAVIMAVAGLIAGTVYSFGGLIYDLATIGLNGGTALAFLALIGMPVLFATAGFFAGAIGAVLYNSTTRWFGGIEMKCENG
ncbi:MAG: hypothetical protein DWQ05_02195 [Calditrichaeota bacterium]|nr:MAG: hypothetical protein DWQ05_02195 [Calditrichota bacterium]